MLKSVLTLKVLLSTFVYIIEVGMDMIVQTNFNCHFSFFALVQKIQVHHSGATRISLLFSIWNNSEVLKHQGSWVKPMITN